MHISVCFSNNCKNAPFPATNSNNFLGSDPSLLHTTHPVPIFHFLQHLYLSFINKLCTDKFKNHEMSTTPTSLYTYLVMYVSKLALIWFTSITGSLYYTKSCVISNARENDTRRICNPLFHNRLRFLPIQC